MNVKRIVVDELPKSCWECGISQVGIQGKWYCPILNEAYLSNVRPDACPLVVEEVCEWEQVEHDSYSATFLLGCKTKRMALGYSGSLTYVYCPSCGKRIVYKESE